MSLGFKNFFILNTSFTLLIVGSSFFFEYFYKLTPCKICLIQRNMWICLLISFLLAIFQIPNKKIISIISSIILFLLSLTALYHSLIEHGLIKNLLSCSTSSGLEATSVEELSNILLNTENNDCSFPKFSFYGITLSNLSFMASLILLLFNLQVTKKILFNNYES